MNLEQSEVWQQAFDIRARAHTHTHTHTHTLWPAAVRTPKRTQVFSKWIAGSYCHCLQRVVFWAHTVRGQLQKHQQQEKEGTSNGD